MNKHYPNSGALFPTRQKRSERSPDCTGDISIEGDVLQSIIEAYNSGQPVKIRLTGYNKPMRDGGRFVSLKAYVADDQQQGGYQQRPQHGAQQVNPGQHPAQAGHNYGYNQQQPNPRGAQQGHGYQGGNQAPKGGGSTFVDDEIPF